MSRVKLYLFGSPHFVVDGQPVKLELRKSLGLLAYLAIQKEVLQRDFITNLFWPEEEPSRGRSHLRHILSPLRIALPEGCLAANRETIGLQPDVALWVDVLEFRRLASSCGQHGHPERDVCPSCQPLLAQAVGLYQDDFMAGFTLPDSANFDEWQYFQAEGLRQALDGVLKKLAQYLVLANSLDQAIQPARRRLVIDPLNEDAHCDLIRLYAWTHQRNLALRQYRECKEALVDQLGIDPQTATLDLMRAIESGQVPTRPTYPTWQLLEAPDQTSSIQENRESPISHVVPALKYTLPVQLTSFIGRLNEIDEIKALVRDHRLVTLTGSGGVGKTRLALQVAEGLLDAFQDGVCLVDLAPLADPELVLQTVTAALGLAEQPGKIPFKLLTDFLQPRQLFLILDNCEHLLKACTELVDALLHSAPRLAVLATSREILGVAGEIHYRVPPLAMPDPRHLPHLDELAMFDALRLFVERAGVVSPGFALKDENAAEVVQITHNLDGIPLAIELAAARVRLLSVGQIAQRLDDVFRLLTSGSRTALPRHQTLTALIDWSYNLLSEAERGLLRSLSVFAGDWTLEAAEEVCGGSHDVLDLLGKLADKSLIQVVPGSNSQMRYHMLETVRQYAYAHLVDAREAVTMRQHHLDYYLGLAESLEPKLRGREQIQTLDYLKGELDNLRLALEWSLQADVEIELRLAAALQWFWHIRYHWTEAIAWLEQGLEVEALNRRGLPLGGTRAVIRANALTALGLLFRMRGRDQSLQVRAVAALEEAIGLYRANGLVQHRDLAWALMRLGNYKYDDGDPAHARILGEEALSLFRGTSDPHGMAESLQLLGECEIDPLVQKKIYQEQLTIEEGNGDIDGIAVALLHIAFTWSGNGDYENACDTLRASREHYRQVGNNYMVAAQGFMLAMNTHCTGDLERAALYLEEARLMSFDIANDFLIVCCLGWKIMMDFTQGRYDQVGELIEESRRIAQNTGDPGSFSDIHFYCARLARLQGDGDAARQHAMAGLNIVVDMESKVHLLMELTYLALKDGDLARAGELCREGLQVNIDGHDMSTMNWVMDGLAVLAVREGKLERAARLFGTRQWRGYVHILSPIERAEREADLSEVKAALGEERFAIVQAEGAAMSFMQVLALAQEEG